MRNDNENLNELLGRFFEGQEASKAADDLRAGREIFETYPAPAPDAGTIKYKGSGFTTFDRKNKKSGIYFDRVSCCCRGKHSDCRLSRQPVL